MTSAPIHWKTRVFSAGFLAALAAAAALGAWTAYLALTDSWVAPLTLSPSNEKVVALRIERARQQTERRRLESEATTLEATLGALRVAQGRLEELREQYVGAKGWALGAQAEETAALSSELTTLKRQMASLDEIIVGKRRLAEQAKADLASGLITRSAYEREELEAQTLALQRDALLRDTTRIESNLRLSRGRGWHQGAGNALDKRASPDVVRVNEQAIRIELELARVDAERRGAESRLRSLQSSLAEVSELERELQSRPLYRAMQEELAVVFVPYSQIEGVTAGASLYQCFAGVFGCRQVGTVREIVAGEVVLQDPWGNPARGQTAVVDLWDRVAAKEKVLRVRGVAGENG
jgi:hypothetical protein